MIKKFTLILLIAICFSCEKDEFSNAENLYGEWKILRLEPNGLFNNDIQPDTYNPIVTFYEDGSLGLRLSANGCGGNYLISDVNALIINSVFCTEICCDDDFSSECARQLQQVTSFEISHQNNLELINKGWGRIILTRLD